MSILTDAQTAPLIATVLIIIVTVILNRIGENKAVAPQ
jgi:hypothetical protein